MKIEFDSQDLTEHDKDVLRFMLGAGRTPVPELTTWGGEQLAEAEHVARPEDLPPVDTSEYSEFERVRQQLLEIVEYESTELSEGEQSLLSHMLGATAAGLSVGDIGSDSPDVSAELALTKQLLVETEEKYEKVYKRHQKALAENRKLRKLVGEAQDAEGEVGQTYPAQDSALTVATEAVEVAAHAPQPNAELAALAAQVATVPAYVSPEPEVPAEAAPPYEAHAMVPEQGLYPLPHEQQVEQPPAPVAEPAPAAPVQQAPKPLVDTGEAIAIRAYEYISAGQGDKVRDFLNGLQLNALDQLSEPQRQMFLDTLPAKK